MGQVASSNAEAIRYPAATVPQYNGNGRQAILDKSDPGSCSHAVSQLSSGPISAAGSNAAAAAAGNDSLALSLNVRTSCTVYIDDNWHSAAAAAAAVGIGYAPASTTGLGTAVHANNSLQTTPSTLLRMGRFLLGQKGNANEVFPEPPPYRSSERVSYTEPCPPALPAMQPPAGISSSTEQGGIASRLMVLAETQQQQQDTSVVLPPITGFTRSSLHSAIPSMGSVKQNTKDGAQARSDRTSLSGVVTVPRQVQTISVGCGAVSDHNVSEDGSDPGSARSAAASSPMSRVGRSFGGGGKASWSGSDLDVSAAGNRNNAGIAPVKGEVSGSIGQVSRFARTTINGDTGAAGSGSWGSNTMQAAAGDNSSWKSMQVAAGTGSAARLGRLTVDGSYAGSGIGRFRLVVDGSRAGHADAVSTLASPRSQLRNVVVDGSFVSETGSGMFTGGSDSETSSTIGSPNARVPIPPAAKLQQHAPRSSSSNGGLGSSPRAVSALAKAGRRPLDGKGTRFQSENGSKVAAAACEGRALAQQDCAAAARAMDAQVCSQPLGQQGNAASPTGLGTTMLQNVIAESEVGPAPPAVKAKMPGIVSPFAEIQALQTQQPQTSACDGSTAAVSSKPNHGMTSPFSQYQQLEQQGMTPKPARARGCSTPGYAHGIVSPFALIQQQQEQLAPIKAGTGGSKEGTPRISGLIGPFADIPQQEQQKHDRKEAASTKPKQGRVSTSGYTHGIVSPFAQIQQQETRTSGTGALPLGMTDASASVQSAVSPFALVQQQQEQKAVDQPRKTKLSMSGYAQGAVSPFTQIQQQPQKQSTTAGLGMGSSGTALLSHNLKSQFAQLQAPQQTNGQNGPSSGDLKMKRVSMSGYAHGIVSPFAHPQVQQQAPSGPSFDDAQLASQPRRVILAVKTKVDAGISHDKKALHLKL